MRYAPNHFTKWFNVWNKNILWHPHHKKLQWLSLVNFIISMRAKSIIKQTDTNASACVPIVWSSPPCHACHCRTADIQNKHPVPKWHHICVMKFKIQVKSTIGHLSFTWQGHWTHPNFRQVYNPEYCRQYMNMQWILPRTQYVNVPSEDIIEP